MRTTLSTNLLNKRWLTGCLFLFLFSCRQKNTESTPAVSIQPAYDSVVVYKKITGALDSIHTGDMITRTGNDFTSTCLRKFCQTDDSYSHCGIASIENGKVYVYHALGGEFNPDQKLLRESFESFVAPAANRGFGIFRANLPKQAEERLMTFARITYQKGVAFDMDFDLATDERLYCSEFAAKSYQFAWHNDSLFQQSAIGQFKYYAPDNLFKNPQFHTIYRVVF